MTWTCPRCDRTFGRARAHVCEPGVPIELWLDGLPDPQRRAATAVLRVIRRIRGLVIEGVGIGVLVKRDRTLVELRSKSRWLQLSFIVARAPSSPRITRTIETATGVYCVVRLHDARDVDAEVRRWLAQSLKA